MQQFLGRAVRDMRTGGAGAAPPPALQPQPTQSINGQRAGQHAQTPSVPAEALGPTEQIARARQNAAATMNHMESSVTRLLFATKMLLESLTQWCRGTRSETDVSDVYVRLGNDFKVAISAFSSYGIDMSDLYSVPPDLRVCLEDCLSEPASPAVLDRHLPRIREIIIRMLEGLKRKQQAYKELETAPPAVQQPPMVAPRRSEPRRAHIVPERSVPMPGPVPTAMPETPVRDVARADAAAALEKHPSMSETPADANLHALRSSDALERRASKRFSAYTINKMGFGGTVLGTPLSGVAATRSASGERAGRSPVLARYSSGEAPVATRPLSGIEAWTPKGDSDVSWISEPAAAITTDREGDTSVGRVDGTTAAQQEDHDTPANGDATVIHAQPQSETPKEPDWVSVAAALPAGDAQEKPLPIPGGNTSTKEAPEAPGVPDAQELPAVAARITEQLDAHKSVQMGPDSPSEPPRAPSEPVSRNPFANAMESRGSTIIEPATPTLPNSLTLFLQLGPHTRKVNFELDNTRANRGLSTARLRMLFVDQFTYSPGMDDFPDIYIKDPSSGILYQLEDLDDVHDKSLLTLNIERVYTLTSSRSGKATYGPLAWWRKSRAPRAQANAA